MSKSRIGVASRFIVWAEPLACEVESDLMNVSSDGWIDMVLVMGEVFETLTVTDLEAALPAASNAVTVRVCEPDDTVVEFQDLVYGGAISAYQEVPSIKNSVLVTPILSVALADTVTLGPLTVGLKPEFGRQLPPLCQPGGHLDRPSEKAEC